MNKCGIVFLSLVLTLAVSKNNLAHLVLVHPRPYKMSKIMRSIKCSTCR